MVGMFEIESALDNAKRSFKEIKKDIEKGYKDTWEIIICLEYSHNAEYTGLYMLEEFLKQCRTKEETEKIKNIIDEARDIKYFLMEYLWNI